MPKLPDYPILTALEAADKMFVEENNVTKQMSAGTLADFTTSAMPLATTILPGKIELSTSAESVTGITSGRAVTPQSLTGRMAEPGEIGGTTPAPGTFTDLTATSANMGNLIVDSATTTQDLTATSANTNNLIVHSAAAIENLTAVSASFGDAAVGAVNINSSGEVVFTGIGGPPVGSMYAHDVSETITITSAGSAMPITSGLTVGLVKGMTFQNNSQIVVENAGWYSIIWSISFQMASGSGQEIEGGICINGAINLQGSAHRKVSNATDTGNMAADALLDLSAGTVVGLWMVNEGSTNNIILEHGSMIVEQKGG